MAWYSKIGRKTFTIILYILLFIFLPIGFLGDSGTYLIGNLLPEIIGVLIELLIILSVFDKWQENSKSKKLISLERRLREYMIFFLKNNFRTLPAEYQVGSLFGKDHIKNIAEIKKLIKYIEDNKLKEVEENSIQEHCSMEVETLGNLLSVASELTNEHFKAWCRIVYFVNCITNRKEPVSSATIEILQQIKAFD